MANKKYDDSEGVWRTIGGRRVFIKTGQSLSDAMKESGKFKNAKKEDNGEKDDLEKKYEHAFPYHKQTEEEKKYAEEVAEYYKGKDIKQEVAKVKEEANKHITKEDAYRQAAKELGYKRHTSDEKQSREIYERAEEIIKEHPEITEYEKMKEDTWGQAAKELGYKRHNSDEKQVREINDRYQEILKEREQKNNKAMNNAIRAKSSKKSNEPDLPKHTEIKEQGNSNRKEVSENIQAHILDYYTEDYTGENISPQDAFIRQMDAMGEPNLWRAGQHIAEGGSYLIYNGDMADFLDSLKINPKGKTFSEDKAFDMYTNLIGRESAKLYDRIKRNAYNEYKKEHPLTRMTFEEFKNMKK